MASLGSSSPDLRKCSRLKASIRMPEVSRVEKSDRKCEMKMEGISSNDLFAEL